MNYMEKYKKYKKKYLDCKNQQNKDKGRKSLLIFDFDKTISKTSLRLSTDFFEYYLCDLFTNEFIQELRDFKKNNVIAIASFGYRKAIDLFLEKYGLTDLFNTIITPAAFGLQEGYDYGAKFNGKNRMILAILEIYPNTKKVMLVDDNIININRALKAGHDAVLSDENGLTDKQKDDIMAFIRDE